MAALYKLLALRGLDTRWVVGGWVGYQMQHTLRHAGYQVRHVSKFQTLLALFSKDIDTSLIFRWQRLLHSSATGRMEGGGNTKTGTGRHH